MYFTFALNFTTIGQPSCYSDQDTGWMPWGIGLRFRAGAETPACTNVLGDPPIFFPVGYRAHLSLEW